MKETVGFSEDTIEGGPSDIRKKLFVVTTQI